MSTSHHRKALAVLLVISLAVRLAAGWAWQSRLDGRFGMGDSESYWALAAAIAAGKPYECGPEHARVFRTPGYPILLAPILHMAGDNDVAVLLARAEAALLGTLAVAGVWWLGRLLFDDRTALLAAALAAFYPGAIVMSILVLSEAPFCAIMLLQLGLWTMAWRARPAKKAAFWAFFGGLAAGAATLMRPSWLLFTPLAALVAVALRPSRWRGTVPIFAGTAAKPWSTKMGLSPLPVINGRTVPLPQNSVRSRWRQVWIGGWLLTGLCVAMLPWWIRNACVTGRFVPTTLQVGASLYDGLNPHATGASNMDFVPGFVAQQERQAASQTLLDGSNDSAEVQLDHRMRSGAIAWATTNPGRAAELAVIKFLRMWNVWPNEPRMSSWPIRLAVLFTYTPLLIFAIIGVWRTLDRGWPYILCWLPAVYFTLLHMVFVSSIRYREPAMLALLALAAEGVLITVGSAMRTKRS